MPLRVKVVDTETGDVDECEVADGDYVIICALPCFVHNVEPTFDGETHKLTVKGRTVEKGMEVD